MTFSDNTVGFLPSWWIDATRPTSMFENLTARAPESKHNQSLVPALSFEELLSLAKILFVLQDSYFESVSRGDVFCVELEKIQTLFPRTSDAELLSIDRLCRFLPSLKFLENGKLESLFEVDEAQPYDCNKIYFKVTPHLVKVLFGLEEIYSSELSPSSTLKNLNRRKFPVPVSFALWGELEGKEKLAFANMLATQLWTNQWDPSIGVFYQSLASFYLPDDDQGVERFFANLKLKLENAEYITDQNGQLSLRVQNHKNLTSLVWTPHHSLVSLLNGSRFEQLVKGFQQNFNIDASLILAQSVDASPMTFEDQDQVRNAVTLIKGVLDSAEQNARQHLLIDGELGPIFIPYLFLEWCLRSSPMHPQPLPNVFHRSLFSELCQFDPVNLAQNYEKFSSIVSRDRYVLNFLKSVPEASLVFTRRPAEQEAPKELGLETATKEAVVNKSASIQDAVIMKSEQTLSQGSQSSPVPQPKVSPPQPAPEPEPKDRQDIGHLNRIQNTKIAKRELQRIRRFDISQYNELKSKYVNSLPENQRAIITELQKSLRKDLFEDQMSQKLVGYMLEHQGEWTSVPSQRN